MSRARRPRLHRPRHATADRRICCEPLEDRTYLSGDPLDLTKLFASDPMALAQFGAATGADAGTVVVGAPFDIVNGTTVGAVHIFEQVGGSFLNTAKLSASGANSSDLFGNAVDISEGLLVVGAPRFDGVGIDSGAAFVFGRVGGQWMQLAVLTADDAAAQDNFGHSVGVSGDVIVVGAMQDDDNGSNSGSAYIFLRDDAGTPNDLADDTWTQQAKLVANDGAANARFGQAVDASGDYVVIGAPRDGGANLIGAAYVFEHVGDSWDQQQKLMPDDAAPGDFNGWDVAIDGDTIVVGQAQAKFMPGAANVFAFDGTSWQQQGKLTAANGVANDRFGRAVAVDGDSVMVGAANLGPAGSAHLFERDGGTWSLSAELVPADGAAGDQFGAAVAMGDGTMLIGALNDDDGGANAGAAYVVGAAGDTTPPVVMDAPQLAPGSDTGASDSDNLTNLTNPTFVGHTEPGATVQVYDNGELIGTTDADANGDWTFADATLDEGAHAITATATDEAGNTSDMSPPLDVMVDLTAVAVTSVDLGQETNSIVIHVDSDDLDVPSVFNEQSYRVMLSNGDSNGNGDPFDDGDETEAGLAELRYDSNAKTITLITDAPLVGQHVRVMIDGDGAGADANTGLSDGAGNFIAGGDQSFDLDATIQGRIGGLQDAIADLDLRPGRARRMNRRLHTAIHLLDHTRANLRAVIVQLRAFKRLAKRALRHGEIDQAAFDTLADTTNSLIADLKEMRNNRRAARAPRHGRR